jgi:hypothetical protein
VKEYFVVIVKGYENGDLYHDLELEVGEHDYFPSKSEVRSYVRKYNSKYARVETRYKLRS